MKRFILFFLIASFSVLAITQTRTQAQRRPVTPPNPPSSTRNPQALLPLKRVILYSNGVAYFERRGTVTGKAEINLAFKQSQVDDVLKSLVVLDLGKGRIGAVSYNSSAPAAARLNEIPFSISPATDAASGGLAGVLRQLQGAQVMVTTATRTTSGAIITLGERMVSSTHNEASKETSLVKTHTLVLATEGGELQSFDLNDVRSVKLLDEGTKTDLTSFATATASTRRRDAKTITVTSDGEGAREMVVSYTIAAPIWKTTYRVVLDQAGKPFFQGWAIVDNVSEEDWTNVSLSMVSGTPVSFIQPIQQPLYRHRPVVPIPSDLQLEPQTYEQNFITNLPDNEKDLRNYLNSIGERKKSEQIVVDGFQNSGRLPPKPTAQALEQNMTATVTNSTGFARPTISTSTAIASGDSGVETAAQGEEVGELFEYRVEQPVTVLKDRSALIPILQTQMEGERVSVFNETTRRDRPMNGIRLKNTSALTLEGGALTVLDGDAYAGEALIERLKAGEQRFISYGLDLGTLATTKFKSERKPVFLVRALNGVFETHYYQTETKTYTLINQTDKPRTVYIEHPLRVGWKLSEDTKKPASQTLNYYRFRVELPARQTVELPVTETLPLQQTYQLTDLSSRDVELFVAGSYIDAATKAELDKLLAIKTRIAQTEARIEKLEEESEEIEKDQARLRENIKSLKDTADAKQLIARYIAKADQQETRIEQMNQEKKAAETQLAQLQSELAAAVRALVLERKL